MKKKHDETVDEEYVEYEETADPDQPEEFYEGQPDDTYYEYEEEQPEESQTGDEQSSKEDKKAKKSVFATTFGNTPFYETTAETISDVLSFHHYKRLKLAPAILLGIALSPFLISFIMLAASFYVLLFAYKMLIAPADYMITSMKSDHDSIWVQLIIYLMGYPVVLFFRIAGALIGIGFFFINFLINCFGYVYSLGGIHFHAFLYDTPSQHKGFKKTPYTMAENIVALVCAIVILVGYMTGIIVSAVGSGSSYDYSNYDDYASNTSRSDAQSMSPSDRDTFLVRDGDSAADCIAGLPASFSDLFFSGRISSCTVSAFCFTVSGCCPFAVSVFRPAFRFSAHLLAARRTSMLIVSMAFLFL